MIYEMLPKKSPESLLRDLSNFKRKWNTLKVLTNMVFLNS